MSAGYYCKSDWCLKEAGLPPNNSRGVLKNNFFGDSNCPHCRSFMVWKDYPSQDRHFSADRKHKFTISNRKQQPNV